MQTHISAPSARADALHGLRTGPNPLKSQSKRLLHNPSLPWTAWSYVNPAIYQLKRRENRYSIAVKEDSEFSIYLITQKQRTRSVRVRSDPCRASLGRICEERQLGSRSPEREQTEVPVAISRSTLKPFCISFRVILLENFRQFFPVGTVGTEEKL